jgi:hypothetical protein
VIGKGELTGRKEKRSMSNEFTFQSVGHGLFYTGRLLNGRFNFVYDCGGNKDPLKKAISDYTEKVKKIDFLVVSHLDRDHVDGIYHLHKASKKIEKIYLPYLETDRLVIELTIANFLSTRLEQNDLLNAFRWWVKVYKNEDPEIRSVIVSEEEEIPPFMLETGEPYWYFKMFNKIKNGKIKNMPVDVAAIEKDIEIFLGGKEIEKCLFDTNDRRKLHEIYKTHCSSINGSSTILIHYPANDRDNGFSPGNDKYLDFCSHSREFQCIQTRPATTILTGDAEFDKDMLYKMKDIIPKRENDIKIFQVPHHGAEKNWDLIELVKFDFDIYVISFKYGDEYHPHRKVILELTLARKYMQVVTQLERCSYFYFIGDQQVVPITQTPIPTQP